MNTETQRVDVAPSDSAIPVWKYHDLERENTQLRIAQASQAAELAALKADIAKQATEIEALKDQLASIRKWATGWSEVPYDDPWKFAAQELLSSMDMHAAMQTKEAS